MDPRWVNQGEGTLSNAVMWLWGNKRLRWDARRCIHNKTTRVQFTKGRGQEALIQRKFPCYLAWVVIVHHCSVSLVCSFVASVRCNELTESFPFTTPTTANYLKLWNNTGSLARSKQHYRWDILTSTKSHRIDLRWGMHSNQLCQANRKLWITRHCVWDVGLCERGGWMKTG